MDIKQYEQDVTHYAVEITKYLMARGNKFEAAEDTVHDTILKIISLDIVIEPDKLRA